VRVPSEPRCRILGPPTRPALLLLHPASRGFEADLLRAVVERELPGITVRVHQVEALAGPGVELGDVGVALLAWGGDRPANSWAAFALGVLEAGEVPVVPLVLPEAQQPEVLANDEVFPAERWSDALRAAGVALAGRGP
jgi:hypothetical protein